MTFAPAIPAGGDNLSVSQGQIQNNFTQLNNIFAFDHFTWNDATSANRGLHKQVTIPAVLSVDPTVTGVIGEVYTKSVAGLTQLFFANSTEVSQLTGLTVNTTGGNSSIVTPWGITFNFGIIGNAGNVTFATPFTTTAYTAQATAHNAVGTANASVFNVSTTGMSIASNATNSIYYLAIGD